MRKNEPIGCEINGRKFVFHGNGPKGWIMTETVIAFASQCSRELREAGGDVNVICYDGGEHSRKAGSREYITFSDEDYPCFFVTSRRQSGLENSGHGVMR